MMELLMALDKILAISSDELWAFLIEAYPKKAEARPKPIQTARML
jgi:hypothetical protein